MPNFRKKPIVIEAIQWNNLNTEQICEFVGKQLQVDLESETAYVAGKGAPIFSITIPTLEGDMKAMPGDWIIKGIKGEFYPCKPDIFEKSYESASVSNWVEITEDTLPEETEPVLWATFPVVEPPEVASMCDEDFTYERFTHYRRMTNDFFQ